MRGGGEEGEKVVCWRGLVISTSGTGTAVGTGTLGDQETRRSRDQDRVEKRGIVWSVGVMVGAPPEEVDDLQRVRGHPAKLRVCEGDSTGARCL